MLKIVAACLGCLANMLGQTKASKQSRAWRLGCNALSCCDIMAMMQHITIAWCEHTQDPSQHTGQVPQGLLQHKSLVEALRA